MRSIRTTLALGIVGCALILFVLAGTALYWLVRDQFIYRFDETLWLKGDALLFSAELPALVSDDCPADVREEALNSFEELLGLDENGDDEDPPEFFIQVWQTAGRMVYRSPSLENANLQRKNTAHPSSDEERFDFRWTTLPDGRAGRAFEAVVEVDECDGQATTVVVARDATVLEEDLVFIRNALGILGVSVIALQVIVLFFLVKRGLKPINQLTREIDSLDERDLSARVGSRVPVELSRFVAQLNNLLSRLEAAFARERSFSDDVAHELRTPLAGLKMKFDLALTKARQPDEYRQIIQACSVIRDDTESTVNAMLSLARLDSGRVQLHADRMQVNDMLQVTWESLTESAACQFDPQWQLQEACSLVTDQELFARIVVNILDNVIVHGDPRGQVKIATRQTEQGVVIEVVNTGSALTQQQAEDAFQRFWRGDQSREGTGRHCGLGLSLVKRCAEVLGGQVAVRSVAGGEFQIRVTLPQLDSPVPNPTSAASRHS